MVIRTIAGDSKNVIIEGTCVSCGKDWSVKAPLAGVIARQNGALIQVAFPNMPAAERELFVSGICDDCFPKEEEEDADEEDADANPYKNEDFKTGRGFAPKAAEELNADEIEGDKLGDDPSNWY